MGSHGAGEAGFGGCGRPRGRGGGRRGTHAGRTRGGASRQGRARAHVDAAIRARRSGRGDALSAAPGRAPDDKGTVEFLFAEGFVQKTRENEQTFTQYRFSSFLNPLNATIGVVCIV